MSYGCISHVIASQTVSIRAMNPPPNRNYDERTRVAAGPCLIALHALHVRGHAAVAVEAAERWGEACTLRAPCTSRTIKPRCYTREQLFVAIKRMRVELRHMSFVPAGSNGCLCANRVSRKRATDQNPEKTLLAKNKYQICNIQGLELSCHYNSTEKSYEYT